MPKGNATQQTYRMAFIDGNLIRSFVGLYSSGRLTKPREAVGLVRSGEVAYIAAHDLQEFTELWRALV